MRFEVFVLFLCSQFIGCHEFGRQSRISESSPSVPLYERKLGDSTIVINQTVDNDINSGIPKWDWVVNVVKTGSITPSAYANKITDSAGNTYITNYIPTTENSEDVYVAKYDQSGNRIWETIMGGKGRDSGHDLALDKEENVWVVGYFETNGKFGSFELDGDSRYNMFLVMIDSDGNCKKAYKVATDNGGFDYSYGMIGDGQLGGFSISINDQNEIFLGGQFERNLSFDDIVLTSTKRRSTFLGKFNTEGECRWAVKAESSNWCYFSNAHQSSEGESYFFTTCSDTLYVQDSKMDSCSGYSSEWLMSKISNVGECEWVRPVKRSVDYNDSKNSALKFVPIFSIDGQNTFSQDYSEERMWIGEINKESELLRVFPLGNKQNVGEGAIWDIEIDAQQNIYVMGTFSGEAYFGDERIKGKENTRQSGFIAKYLRDGSFAWVKIVHCEGKILWLRSMQVIDDKLIISGNYQVSADFDQFRITTGEQDPNVNEIFIASLNLGIEE